MKNAETNLIERTALLNEDFHVDFHYNSEDDKVTCSTDKILTNADIVLVISNFLGYVEKESRQIVIQIVNDILDTRDQSTPHVVH